MPNKIKVLFLAADPSKSTARLELGEEMRAIDHAIQRGSARDALEFVSHFATRARDVQQALLRHEPQIVHFAGHGDRPGIIYLEDERGGRKAVNKEALVSLFEALRGGVRVVVLNGCHTLPVAEVLSGIVDYAIGTTDRISDEAAIQFSNAFYTALAFGKDVRQAFDLAVSHLRMDGNADADILVLRVRAGATPDPLLSAPVETDAEPAGGVEVVQDADLGDVDVDVATIVGLDQQDPGTAAARVRQNIRSNSVTGGEFNLTGAKITRPGRE